jgi:hypothetical protein
VYYLIETNRAETNILSGFAGPNWNKLHKQTLEYIIKFAKLNPQIKIILKGKIGVHKKEYFNYNASELIDLMSNLQIKETKLKKIYYTKELDKVSKDIIGFELHINWNLPIILVEGAFDAITIKRNVIPLFGKTISKELLKKLIEKQPPNIYIILDNDAINESYGIIEKLQYNSVKSKI